jgi:hypothetical protein
MQKHHINHTLAAPASDEHIKLRGPCNEPNIIRQGHFTADAPVVLTKY